MQNDETCKAIAFLKVHAVRWKPGWFVQVVAIHDGGRIEAQCATPDRLDDLALFIEAHNGTANLYFAVNPLDHSKGTKARKADVAAVMALHVDIDPRPGEPLDGEQERIRVTLQGFSPEPSAVVFTGGGCAAYWLLPEPIGVEEGEALNRRIAQTLGGDNCWNADRIMRLPGTLNLPNEKKRATGRVETQAVVLSNPGHVYAPADFAGLPPDPKAADRLREFRDSLDTIRPGTPVPFDGFIEDDAEQALIEGELPEGERNEPYWRIQQRMLRHGIEPGDVLASMLECNGTRAYLESKTSPSEPTALARAQREIERGCVKLDISSSRPKLEALAAVYAAALKGSPYWNQRAESPVNAGTIDEEAALAELDKRFTNLGRMELKPVEWVIEDYIPVGVTEIFGKSGSCKSFAALDIALCVNTGHDWHGHRVARQGAVIYVAFEGQSQMPLRVAAWCAEHDISPDSVSILMPNRPLTFPDLDCQQWLDESLTMFKKTGSMPALCVIDTVARSMSGDENSTSDMAAYVRALDALRLPHGLPLLLIHHTGLMHSKRGRGNGSLFNALDAVHLMERRDGLIKFGSGSPESDKMKDAPIPPPIHLTEKRIDLGIADGKPVSSLVLVSGASGREAAAAEFKEKFERLATRYGNVVKILECLTKFPDQTGAAVSEATGISSSRCDVLMKTMREAGLLEGGGRGEKWRLSGEGVDWARRLSVDTQVIAKAFQDYSARFTECPEKFSHQGGKSFPTAQAGNRRENLL